MAQITDWLQWGEHLIITSYIAHRTRGITMFVEITEERIIAISKKLNVYDESLSVEDLKDLALNTIEEVARRQRLGLEKEEQANS